MDGNYTLSDIAAVTDGNRNNGMFGGDWSAWIILFLLFGMFGNERGQDSCRKIFCIYIKP